jgi:arylsulfatase A-like enzyme
VIIPHPNVLMHWDPARGTGHGSQYRCDTNVPLVFLGGPFRPTVSAEPVTPYDLAPTLARLLGVTLPDATGRALLPAAAPARPAAR